MKIPISLKEKLKFWRKKLKKHQKRYDELRQQSPGRWWHDEHFDNQMRVLESLITSTKIKVSELKQKLQSEGNKSN